MQFFDFLIDMKAQDLLQIKILRLLRDNQFLRRNLHYPNRHLILLKPRIRTRPYPYLVLPLFILTALPVISLGLLSSTLRSSVSEGVSSS